MEANALSSAARIINKFGGLRQLAKALGHKNPSTVQWWKQTGIIPARRQQSVWDAARARGIELDKSEFAAIEG